MSERPDPYPVPVAPGGVNTPGRIALTLAVIATAVSVALQFLSLFAPILAQDVGAGYAQISGVFGVVGGVHLLLSAGAVIFGAVGITRRTAGQPIVAAGVGLGAGAVGVIGGLIGLIVIPIVASLV